MIYAGEAGGVAFEHIACTKIVDKVENTNDKKQIKELYSEERFFFSLNDKLLFCSPPPPPQHETCVRPGLCFIDLQSTLKGLIFVLPSFLK